MTDWLEDLDIPHVGVPQKQLTASQKRERWDAVRALSPDDRERYSVEVGRRNGHLANGQEASSVAASRFADPDAEADAWPRMLAAGLGLDERGAPLRSQRRRWAVKAFLDAEADAVVAVVRHGDPSASSPREVQIAFHEREAARMRARAARDRLNAEEHDRMAELHETALVELVRAADAP